MVIIRHAEVAKFRNAMHSWVVHIPKLLKIVKIMTCGSLAGRTLQVYNSKIKACMERNLKKINRALIPLISMLENERKCECLGRA